MQIRCPHCRHPVEVVDEKLLDEVICPSCGSNISLVTENATEEFLAPSARQLGHFQLLERVGIGGYGTVWKAHDTVLDRTVALKVPRRGQLDASEIEYFLRDARAAAQLRHPNIVSVHEVGRDGDTVFIASDYVEGANLKEWLAARPMTVREAAEFVAQIADAVQHAHERGVVHRDLKPGNILIDQNGRPNVADFGLAKRETGEVTMTVDGQILGTPAYMSPEQARGKAHEASPASDVYSLGVILFELLTGELPFRGEKRMLILQILNDEPPSPRKLNGRVPRDLETICLKAMSKESARRYVAANDLSADLRRFLAGEPILARPLSAGVRIVRWCRRNQKLTASLSAAAIFLLAGTAVSTYFAITASRSAVTAEYERKRAKDNAVQADQARIEAQKQESLATSQAKHLQRTLYNIRLNQAAAFLTTNPGKARDQLEDVNSCPIELRDFVWKHLYVSCKAEDTLLEGHTNAVQQISFSPDSTSLASASEDTTIRIWDLATRQTKAILRGHTAKVTSVAYSSDGARLVSASEDKTVRVWDVESGQPIATLEGHEYHVHDARFLSGLDRVVSASADSTVRVWDVPTQSEQLVLRGHTSHVHSVCVLREGSLIATGSRDSTIRLCDLSKGSEFVEFARVNYWIWHLSASKDGSQIVSTSFDGITRLWDVATGSSEEVARHKGWAIGADIAPDGKSIGSCGSDGRLVLWDRERKVEVAAVQAHTSKAECVAFSADGKWVATGGADHKIRIWNRSILEGANRVSSHFARTVAEAEHPIEKVRFLDSGELMVMTGGGSLVTLNSLSNERTTDSLFDLSEPVRAVALSNNGTVAIGYQDKFAVVERHNRDPTPNEFKFSVRIDHLAISRDGQWIAVGGKGSPPVYVVDRRNNGKIIPVPDPTAEAVSVAVSDDGRFAALCSWDKMLRVWDLKRGQLHRELPGHTEWATTLRFSRDGTLLCTGAVDGTLRLFDLQNRREREVLRGHGGGAFVGVFEIAFSPDGELVASAGYDKTIRIWDTLTGQEKVLFLPSASAISLDWNPAGTILSCGCLDRSVHFWVSNHNEMVAMPSRE